MVFISAGHNPKGIKTDPGAIGNSYRESDVTVEQRNLTMHELDMLGVKYITDKDDETLAQYLKRIKTGNASVVLEYHFDSASNKRASGSTAIISGDSDRLDRAFAKEIVDLTSKLLDIPNRGVISEKDSHRGKLGLMREEGIVSLLEICFISNELDMQKWQLKKKELASGIARIIKKYEEML